MPLVTVLNITIKLLLTKTVYQLPHFIMVLARDVPLVKWILNMNYNWCTIIYLCKAGFSEQLVVKYAFMISKKQNDFNEKTRLIIQISATSKKQV